MLVWPKSSSNKISCFVILQSTLGPLLQNSKTVAFHFAPNDQESLKALYRVMASHGIKFVSVCALPVQCSTNWAYKPTGSWSLCCFVINPWSDESMTVKIWKSFMWTAVWGNEQNCLLVRVYKVGCKVTAIFPIDSLFTDLHIEPGFICPRAHGSIHSQITTFLISSHEFSWRKRRFKKKTFLNS